MACLTPFLHVLLCFFFLLSVSTYLNQAADSIFFNQSLSGNQSLVSSGGNFVLGFFQPVNSSNYYLGIWYNTVKIPVFTQVWVANRDRPISDPYASELRIATNGNMVILNEHKTTVWSTNTTFNSAHSLVAVLRDDGNFVLGTTRVSSTASSVLWQSFDYISDTWLPGQKMKFNKITNAVQHITSWKSSNDPAPGMYSLSLDPTGINQFVLRWNKSVVYWASGAWIGTRFNRVPEMTFPTSYSASYTFFSNDNESYFIYAISQGGLSIITRQIVDINGQNQQLIWVPQTAKWMLFYTQPKSICNIYRLCGAFATCNEKGLPFCSCIRGFSQASLKDWELGDHSSGCVRDAKLQCGSNVSDSTDDFYIIDDIRLPDNHQTLTVESSSDCELACLKKCSCTAYSYKSSCLLWFGSLLNLQHLNDGSGNTLYLRLAASEFKSSRSNRSLPLWVVIGGILLIACLVIVSLLIHRNILRFRKSKCIDNNLTIYSYTELKRITRNFSEKLGSGGFGSVFKGVLVLPNSSSALVAVKKLEGISQGEKQFRAEVSTLGTIHHINLVRLRGFCSQGTKRLLVYDYMLNGSLADKLSRNSGSVLDWNTRYQIALGTARGLAYLHEKCRDCIIHCDIKPENILLDSFFEPKIADFGLAKLMGRDFSRVLTTVRGTIGYLAPEWISGVAITTKADVYSYGLMLFEIISGKRNWEEGCYFPIYAATKLGEGDVLPVLDHRLNGEGDLEEVGRACLAACWCIQDDEICRPSMGQVVQILEKVLEVDMPPIPRLLKLQLENASSNVLFNSKQQGSSKPTNY